MLLCGASAVLLLLVGGVSAGELDFPPVDLQYQNSSLAVSFTHPLVFHGEPARDDEPFRFTVSTDVGDFPGSCTALPEDRCIVRVPFPAGAEKCASLKGSLAGRRVGRAAFRETGRVCLSVEPPKNVMLSCKNVNVSVSWEHGGQHTSFRVHVGGSAGHLVSETTERRYDLSRFVWASERRYLGFHHVTVTAREGGNQSESTTTSTFTFNRLTPADIKCELDFPAVDLSEEEEDSGATLATLSFVNPLLFYKELKEATRSGGATVWFTASSNHSDFPGDCRAQDVVCKLDILFPAGVEKCVKTLAGWMEGSGGGQVPFRETGPVCASSLTEANVLTLTILLSLFVIVVVAIIFAVWRVNACTLKTPLPEPRISPFQTVEDGGLRYAPVSPPDLSPVTPPGKNTEEEEEEEEEEEAGLLGGAANYLPTGPAYAEGGFSDDSADDSEKTEIVSLEEEEVEEEEVVEEEEEEEVVEKSPYDCPHTLQVDMGDGDMVTGYSER